jgi:hypothetical protein
LADLKERARLERKKQEELEDKEDELMKEHERSINDLERLDEELDELDDDEDQDLLLKQLRDEAAEIKSFIDHLEKEIRNID